MYLRSTANGRKLLIVVLLISSLHSSSSTSSTQTTHTGRGNVAFAYTVTSPETGDFKSHRQHRDPVTGVVHGQYRLLDADGLERVVTYTADPVHGFKADVQRIPVTSIADTPQQYQNSIVPEQEVHTVQEEYVESPGYVETTSYEDSGRYRSDAGYPEYHQAQLVGYEDAEPVPYHSQDYIEDNNRVYSQDESQLRYGDRINTDHRSNIHHLQSTIHNHHSPFPSSADERYNPITPDVHPQFQHGDYHDPSRTPPRFGNHPGAFQSQGPPIREIHKHNVVRHNHAENHIQYDRPFDEAAFGNNPPVGLHAPDRAALEPVSYSGNQPPFRRSDPGGNSQADTYDRLHKLIRRYQRQ